MGRSKAYPEEVVEFVRKNAAGKRRKEIAEITNAFYGTKFTEAGINSFMKNHKIQSGMPHNLLKGERPSKVYPSEIVEFIMQNYVGCGAVEMAGKIKENFGKEYTKNQIKGFYCRNHLNSGLTGYFEKGHIPDNKGKKGIWSPKCEKTWFKKGHRPSDWKPVGTVEIRGDGYYWKKTAEPHTWKELHRIVWEEANGPIPENHCITFLDGNKENVELSNLALISRSENLALTRMKLRSEEAEFTETGILIARLYSEKQKRKKENNGRTD